MQLIQYFMPNETPIQEKILSIYPNVNGLAFSYFESPRNLIDWGNVKCCSKDVSLKFQKLLDNFQPDTIVTEDHKSGGYRRGKRIASMLDDVYKKAEDNSIYLKKYSRCMVKGVFDCLGANNQYETALLLADWYPGLATKLPPKPKVWQWTHYRKGVFDAVSIGLAHYYVTN